MQLTRRERRRLRYSDEYQQIFTFFLQSYRKKILDFSGIEIKTRQFERSQLNKLYDAKYCFKGYDDGDYDKETIYIIGIQTIHPNVLKAVILGKKSWGLHVSMWSDGISEGLFSKREILEQFETNGIIIPESFLLDLDNQIYKKLRNKLF